MKKFSSFVSKNMLWLVIICAVVALFFPASFTWVAPQISKLLGVIMFGMGMTLRIEDFKEIFRRPKEIFIGVAAQFLIMPLLAYFLALIFNLPPELAAGVILVGTCPGGTASNVMTYLAQGDLALSVSMTMTTTLLAPIVTPFLTLWLAGAWIDISLSAMMISILQIVIAPIFLGIIINHFFRDFVRKITILLPTVSIIAILLIVGGVVGVNSSKILDVGLILMLVVMLHNVCGYALGFAVAKAFNMNIAKAKAISIEVGMQNSGLAVSLAMLHFGAAAAIPGAIFSVWHNISGSIAVIFFAYKSNKLN